MPPPIFTASPPAFGQIGSPVLTFQAPRDIRRMAQYGKFFAHLLQRLPLPAGAVGDKRATFTVDGGVPTFAVHRIAVLADNLGAKIQIVATPGGEEFFSDPLYLTHFGNGQKPSIVSPPWLLRGNATITLVADDRQAVAAANNIRLALFGEKLSGHGAYADSRRYNQTKAWRHVANFSANDSGIGSLAANETRVYTITTDVDSDFEAQGITVLSDAPVLVQIGSDSEDWFDSPIRSELLGGSLIEAPVAPEATGNFPFWLPAPRLIGAFMQVRVTNTVAAVVRCQVGIFGHRLYPRGGVAGSRGRQAMAAAPGSVPADIYAALRGA